uniref:Uncharacterized protein n=1 Tax=Culex tarsalis TaxID=7177 RepID=A0A1Q3G540_CULTA
MLGPTPSRVIKIAKEKSQKLFTVESEKFSFKIDRFLTVYHGYNQIKPKIFPKRLTTMFSADVVVPSEDDSRRPDFFQSSPLMATSSLRRHQRERGLREGQLDTSSKIRIVLPANAAAAQTTVQPRSLVGTPRTKKASGVPKTPKKVVLTTPQRICAGNEGILCSSVMLTYKEGLFYHERDMVRNDSDV